jgi:hypothetical protein
MNMRELFWCVNQIGMLILIHKIKHFYLSWILLATNNISNL